MSVVLIGGLAGLLAAVSPGAATEGIGPAFQAGVLPFLGADLIKIAVAAPLVPLLARRRP
jgi:biotin transporter BioY